LIPVILNPRGAFDPQATGQSIRRLRRAEWAAIVVCVCAIVARVGVGILVHNPGSSLTSDMANYDRVAEHLRHGEQDATDAFYPIGYPAFLALVYMVSSRSFLVVAIVQGFFGGATCLLVWILVKRITQSDGVALAAESLTAIYPPLIYYGSMLLTESIAPFWLTLAVWLLIRAIEGPTAARTASAGTALAVATVIRPNLVVLYPFVVLVVWAGQRRLMTAAKILAFSAPLLVIASVNNSRLIGRPCALSTNGGVNFFLLQADIRQLRFYDNWLSPIRNNLMYTSVVDSPVAFDDERYFYREGVKQFLRRPDKVRHTMSNLQEGLGLGLQGYWPANKVLPSDDSKEPDHLIFRRVLRWCSKLFFWALVLPLVVQSAVLLATRRWHMPNELPALLALSVIVTLLLTFATLLADPRVHLPFDPVLLGLAAAAYHRGLGFRGTVVRRPSVIALR
jgi:hypothetical protein